MKKISNRIYRSLIRGIRTMAATGVSVIGIELIMGHGLTCIVWPYLLSVISLAGIISAISLYIFGPSRSRFGLPDGNLLIDRSGDTDIYRLDLLIGFEALAKKDEVSFVVKDNVDLSDAS